MGFNTGSMRNIYSPDVRTAQELIVDQLAKAMGSDPYQFRRAVPQGRRASAPCSTRSRRSATGVGRCRRAPRRASRSTPSTRAAPPPRRDRLPAGDREPHRSPTAYTGPRVTKVVFAVDVGLPINPRGLEAQMMGGIMDGIAQALTSSLHLKRRPLPRGQLGQLLLHAAVERAARCAGDRHAADDRRRPAAPASSAWRRRMAAVACAYARATGNDADRRSRSTTTTRSASTRCPTSPTDPAVADRRPADAF